MLKIELITSDQWFHPSYLPNEPSVKTANPQIGRSFWVGEHMEVLGGGTCREGIEASCPSLYNCPYIPLPSECSRAVSFCRKPVTVSKALSWVQTWRGSRENSPIYSQNSEIQVTAWDQRLAEGGQSWTEPLTRGPFANSKQLASELNQVVGPLIGVSRDLENCLVGTSPNFCCQKWCKCKLLSSGSPLTYALGNLHNKLARMEIFLSWENVRGESKCCPLSNNWTTQRERPSRCKFPD